MESCNEITVVVSHRGQNYTLSLLPDATLSLLQQRLEELTSIPPPLQKLLYKGSKAKQLNGDETILSEAGIKDGTKIQLIGTTPKQLDGLKAEESEQQRRDRIMKERAARVPTKLRSTGRADSSALNYRFHEIVPLPHLPNPETARTMLKRLSDDPAIQHIMQKHQFSVGVLTELAPHEHPELLGLNVNAGQQIKLRIRTNAYDGFRAYRETRKVLCHELTHNVWGDHDNNFKELNSKLNREVAEYERSVSAGTHTLIDGLDDAYEPSAEAEAEARAYVLGGSGTAPQSADERRRRILEATLSRLRKEDEELEDSCGTAGPSAL